MDLSYVDLVHMSNEQLAQALLMVRLLVLVQYQVWVDVEKFIYILGEVVHTSDKD